MTRGKFNETHHIRSRLSHLHSCYSHHTAHCIHNSECCCHTDIGMFDLKCKLLTTDLVKIKSQIQRERERGGGGGGASEREEREERERRGEREERGGGGGASVPQNSRPAQSLSCTFTQLPVPRIQRARVVLHPLHVVKGGEALTKRSSHQSSDTKQEHQQTAHLRHNNFGP